MMTLDVSIMTFLPSIGRVFLNVRNGLGIFRNLQQDKNEPGS
ncbi:hypothetical protein DAQ1742_04011 [Dickeya aquatica]|uniref:Uncharacterized protein n=1 Tax=Dickeya aquatica TaxID=1401087 RepID=A0A375AFC1_9GAMM|nr:hypothetical protein DAQ1742_04011 [Dickeya aquatica]